MAPPARHRFVRMLLGCVVATSLCSPTLATDLDALIESSCIDCHDANTETSLDFTTLKKDFEDAKAFRTWVRVFDRVQNGEMPPAFNLVSFSASAWVARESFLSPVKRASFFRLIR